MVTGFLLYLTRFAASVGASSSSGGGSSSGSVADKPYVEIVPDRYTFAGEPAVAGWSTIPAPCCVESALATRAGMLLLMSSGDLLLAVGDARPRRFEAVELIAANSSTIDATVVGPNATLVSSANREEVMAIVTQTNVLGVSCSSTAANTTATATAAAPGRASKHTCYVHTIGAAGFGAVHDSATVPSPPAQLVPPPSRLASASEATTGGTVAFVAAQTGLYKIEFGNAYNSE